LGESKDKSKMEATPVEKQLKWEISHAEP